MLRGEKQATNVFQLSNYQPLVHPRSSISYQSYVQCEVFRPRQVLNNDKAECFVIKIRTNNNILSLFIVERSFAKGRVTGISTKFCV